MVIGEREKEEGYDDGDNGKVKEVVRASSDVKVRGNVIEDGDDAEPS